VSQAGAGDYADRLLPLPAFLTARTAAGAADLIAGFDLTAYFLERDVYVPSRMRLPPARTRFVDLLRRGLRG
jgi:DNA repair protein RecO (recombination protein O)